MKITDIVKPDDSILIIPAPSGYLIMKALASNEEMGNAENFAALTSAADVIYFLINLYHPLLPKEREEIYGDVVMDIFDVGQAEQNKEISEIEHIPCESKKTEPKHPKEIKKTPNTEGSGEHRKPIKKKVGKKAKIGKTPKKANPIIADTCANTKGNGEKNENKSPSAKCETETYWQCNNCKLEFTTKPMRCIGCNRAGFTVHRGKTESLRCEDNQRVSQITKYSGKT